LVKLEELYEKHRYIGHKKYYFSKIEKEIDGKDTKQCMAKFYNMRSKS